LKVIVVSVFLAGNGTLDFNVPPGIMLMAGLRRLSRAGIIKRFFGLTMVRYRRLDKNLHCLFLALASNAKRGIQMLAIAAMFRRVLGNVPNNKTTNRSQSHHNRTIEE